MTALLAIVAALALGVCASGEHWNEAVIVEDDAGALHINTSSHRPTQPVLLNGHDVLSTIAANKQLIEAQEQLISNQTTLIATLEQAMCDLHPPHLGRIPGAGTGGAKWAGGVLAPSNGLIYGVPDQS